MPVFEALPEKPTARINLASFAYTDTKSPSAAGPLDVSLSVAGQSFKSVASGVLRR